MGVPVIGIEFSLVVIVGVLVITTIASLVKVRLFPTGPGDEIPGSGDRTDEDTPPDAAPLATDAAPPTAPRT